MSVYTMVNDNQMQSWLRRYPLGHLLDLQGIASGITNTNYLVTTTIGRYVLTLFEALKFYELPYYLTLMDHLARHGVACPTPIADSTGQFISMLAGKPACLVSCLDGAAVTTPTAAQGYAVGKMLAKMHIAASTFHGKMSNPRGPHWWEATAREVYPHMEIETATLLRDELRFQTGQCLLHLPCGVIHADLFRDNVLFEEDRISGFIDFYYACNDFFLYDLAIAVNDWAYDEESCLDDQRAAILIDGYQSERSLTAEEAKYWPIMLRAAALRFWLSRLQDFYLPTQIPTGHTKDPGIFQAILKSHQSRRDFWVAIALK